MSLTQPRRQHATTPPFTGWIRSSGRSNAGRNRSGRPLAGTRTITLAPARGPDPLGHSPAAEDTAAMPTPQWDKDDEPDLASVLSDPIVALVMSRDGLSPDEVARIAHVTRDRLRAVRQS